MKRIIITGPTGAIGIALIKKSIKENVEVLAICRPDSERTQRIPNHSLVKKVYCDLSDLKKRESFETDKAEVFFHLAWSGTVGEKRNDMQLQLKNVEYALDAVDLAEQLGCHTFIGAGSQAEYGRVEGMLSEETPTFPENGYGMAKLCAGQMTAKECEKKGLRHIWPRILSVYGPYDGENSMISSAGKMLLAGNKPSFTKGEQKWDYLYSDDAAEALWLLGKKSSGGVYVLGSGQTYPLKEYIFQLRDCIDPNLQLGMGELPYSQNQVMNLCADISKLTADTGFVPTTSFSEGIKKTVEWMRGA